MPRAQMGDAMNSESKPTRLPVAVRPDGGKPSQKTTCGKPQTMGELLQRRQEEAFEGIWGLFPKATREAERRKLLRPFAPWPDWVLKVATEVIHVQIPRIPKQTIQDSLRFIHFIVLEMRRDGTNAGEAPPFPKLDPEFAGALGGHLDALSGKFQKEADEILETACKEQLMPPERLEEYQRLLSREKFKNDFAAMIVEYFQDKPGAVLEFQDAYAKARQSTFDESGSLKETTLTEIYRRILDDWIVIETLSGPTALCEYLSPLLPPGDPESKLDRIKKVCRRMKIAFKPFVEGQTRPPGRSL